MSSQTTRAVVVDHSAALGGAQLNMPPMAEYLPDVLSFVLLEDGPIATALRRCGARVCVEPIGGEIGPHLIGRRDPRTAATLLRVARKLKTLLTRECRATGSTVLVINSLRALLLLSLVGPPRGTKVMVLVRDIVARPYLSTAEVVLTRTAVRRLADLVVANSLATLRAVGAGQAAVLPPFISSRFFDPVAPRESSIDLELLLLGRVVPWKGQLFGLEALAATGHRIRVAGGTWFGDSEYAARVSEYAASYSNVEMLGHRDDVVDLIDSADAVLHTSVIPEPFGQVIAQGMARQRLVIASRAGGPAEAISDGYDGLLFTIGRAESLREVVRELEPNKIARISAAGRSTSLVFHPARTAHRLRSMIDELGGRP